MSNARPGVVAQSTAGAWGVRIAALLIAIGFTNIGIAIVNPQAAGNRDQFVLIGIFCVVGGLFVMGFANRHIAKSQAASQIERDRIAAEIVAALKSGGTSPAPFALYLRSFKVTGALPERCDIYNAEVGAGALADMAMGAARSRKTDFELLVSHAVAPDLALIGLGKPGEMVGAGRFESTDADWHDTIALLAHAAYSIVFVPASSEGVLWELNFLAENDLLGKTVVCLPSQLETLLDDREILQFIARTEQRVAIIRLGLEWMHFVEYTPAGLKPTDAVGGPLTDFALRSMLQHVGRLPQGE